MKRRLLLPAVLALLLPGATLAQVFVVPRRPDKSPVRTFEFEWRHLDILVGPQAEGIAPPPAHRAHIRPPGTPGGPTPVAPTEAQLRTPLTPGSSEVAQDPRPEPPEPISGSALPPTDGGVAGPDTPPTPGDAGTALAGTVAPDGGAGTSDGGTVAGAGTPDGGYATSLGVKSGGVRFYFYERERNIAQYAAPQLEAAYRYLVDQFKYVPTETFPYILYSSYQEFLQTNVVPVQEGTLGVTSTTGNLELTLPYLGDHRLFGEISSHEMVHQFTIQKVRTLAEQAKVSGDPLTRIPLWFIEGIAEFYAKGGLDPEAEMLVRDLLVNPDPLRGYAFLDFFTPGPYGYLWIYKVGQARVAFLEETYGAGTIQKVLDQSSKLISGTGNVPTLPFEGLLELITGDDPRQIAARFENWLKQRAYRTYLKAEQSAPALDMLLERKGIVTALNSAPEGQLLLYRSIIPETGESQLILVDPRAPEESVRVASDGVPGLESLHPISGRNFALTKDRLAFVAESKGHDLIYLQQYTHTSESLGSGAQGRSPYLAHATELRRGPSHRVSLELGERVVYELARHRLIAAYSPAFSPDGQWLAFIGLNEDGIRDVYVLPLGQGLDVAPKAITQDVYAERQLTWGKSGIVFTSDATSHGYYNLFRVRPDAPAQVERLTTEARDHADPVELPDGRLYFVAFENSRSELHEYTGTNTLVRRTDVSTGLFEPSPGPDGNLWLLFHHSGERKPALLRSQRMMSFPVAAAPAAAPPSPLPQRSLTGAEHYRPFTWENIDIGPVLGFAGAGGGGFVGQVFASAADRLRNHGLILNLAIYGSLELTDGLLLYLNQAGRTTWGAGAFQSLRFRVDDYFKDKLPIPITSGERFFGALGSARYPLSTFLFLQADLSVGGTTYFLTPSTAFFLNLPDQNGVGDLYTPWSESTRGIRFQTEVTGYVGYNTLRYHYTGGPIAGSAVLLETTGGVQPFHNETFGNVRLDAEKYYPIIGRTHLMLRGGVGTTFGGRFARSYYLSSFDTLRGVNFGDERWLLGRHYLYSTLEMQVPLDSIVRIAFLNNIEGVAGLDFGGVGGSARDAWDHRVLNTALGVNVGLGALLLRLHFAYPINVRSPLGKPDDGWVTQFSIGLAGLNGFFSQKDEQPARRAPPISGFTGPQAFVSPR